MHRSYVFALLLAAAVLIHCSKSYSNPTAPPSTPPVQGAAAITILGQMGNKSFSPNPGTAKVGQSIQWKNSDGITHHIVSDTAGKFDAGNIGGGNTSPAVMVNQAGTYPYHCSIHPTMVGSMMVNP
jgi:plastocyanin